MENVKLKCWNFRTRCLNFKSIQIYIGFDIIVVNYRYCR